MREDRWAKSAPAEAGTEPGTPLHRGKGRWWQGDGPARPCPAPAMDPTVEPSGRGLVRRRGGRGLVRRQGRGWRRAPRGHTEAICKGTNASSIGCGTAAEPGARQPGPKEVGSSQRQLFPPLALVGSGVSLLGQTGLLAFMGSGWAGGEDGLRVSPWALPAAAHPALTAPSTGLRVRTDVGVWVPQPGGGEEQGWADVPGLDSQGWAPVQARLV